MNVYLVITFILLFSVVHSFSHLGNRYVSLMRKVHFIWDYGQAANLSGENGFKVSLFVKGPLLSQSLY